jgi:hypothetical protein
MRVRCTATADYRSNAVGELELECTPEGLCIALRGVSSYREGYAPGPPVHASDVCVPWPGVYATRLGERQLQLSLDGRSFASDAGGSTRYLPLNRFLLAQFTERLPDAPTGLFGQRGLPFVLAGTGVVALGIGLGLARALPHAPAFGTLGWAALVVALVLGAIAWRAHTGPRVPSHVVLDELCQELSRYVPQHISAATPTPTPAPRSLEPLGLSRLLPRSAVAIAITLAAATLAALVGSSAARPRSSLAEADTSRTEATMAALAGLGRARDPALPEPGASSPDSRPAVGEQPDRAPAQPRRSPPHRARARAGERRRSRSSAAQRVGGVLRGGCRRSPGAVADGRAQHVLRGPGRAGTGHPLARRGPRNQLRRDRARPGHAGR